MKSPWQIRLDESIKSLVRYARAQGAPVTGKSLKDIEKAVFASTDLAPSTDDFTMYPFENLDIKRFLAYHYAIESDSNTITKALDETEKGLRNLWLLIDIESIATKATEKITKMYIGLLSASTFIDGITREIAIPQEMEIPDPTISLAGGSISLRTESARLNNLAGYVEDDIEILVTKQKSMISNTIAGRKTSILDTTYERGFTLSVFTQRVDDVEATIRIKARAPESNKVTLALTPSVVGTTLTILILPVKGQPLVQVFSDVINQEVLEVQFSPVQVEQLIIKMEKNFPDIKTEKSIEYDFAIEKVKIENTAISRSGSILSKAIKVKEGTTAVALLAEDFIPAGSTIQYELGPVANETDIPDQFFTVQPNNQAPASNLVNNQLPEERFISLVRNKAKLDMSPTDPWNLTVVTGFRRRMFNILEPFEGQSIGSELVIQNGKITAVDQNQGIQIIAQSLNLLNGINDWAHSTGPIVEEDTVENMLLPVIFNDALGWFEPIKMLEPYKQTFIPRLDNLNQIELDEVIATRDNFEVFDEDGQQIAVFINSGMNSKSITVNYTFERNKLYTLKYLIALRNVTTLDLNSFVLKSSIGTLTINQDYIYSAVNNTIILNRGAPGISRDTASKTDLVLTASYKRAVLDERLSKQVVYETWLYLDRTTSIVIQPFTPVEVAAGNFHKIDSLDVSFATSIELGPGEHHLLSTQPDPSSTIYVNDVDVNPLTGVKSSAGIILQGLNYRAYKFPMRQVNLADLELNVDGNDPKVYSYVDGALYLLRQPETVDQGLLDTDTSNNSMGKFIRARIFDGDSGKYLSQPERFTLDITYTTASSKSYVRVRVSISRGGNITPRISRLGIVPVTV